MYNCNRNTQFHRVVHFKQDGHDQLLCKADDFLFGYDYKENQRHLIKGLWDPLLSQCVEFVGKEKDVLHDQRYASKIKKSLQRI